MSENNKSKLNAVGKIILVIFSLATVVYILKPESFEKAIKKIEEKLAKIPFLKKFVSEKVEPETA